MDNDNQGWRSFQKLSIDRKKISRHAKRVEGVTTRHIHKFVTKRIDHIRDARHIIVGWLAVMTVLLAAVMVQLTWSKTDYTTMAADKGGTYSEASLGPISTLNPLYTSSSAEESVSRLLFSSLYNYDKTGHLAGDLAESAKVDADGKTYVVNMRDNAYWHDGKPLTADDVEFTINLIKNPASRSPLRINWQDVSAKATNKYTIEFKLPAVYAAFDHALTFPVLPKHILEKINPSAIRENNFSSAPIGSGPFKFKLLQFADKIRNHKVVHLAANDNYYFGRPMLNRFEVHAYQSQDDILKGLKLAEISGATDVQADEAAKISHDTYKVVSKPVNSGQYLIMNTKSPVMSDVKVRRALQAATDTKKIRQAAGGNYNELYLPFVDSQIDKTMMPKAPVVDVAKANALLDEAGWKKTGAFREKDGRKLSINLTTIQDPQAKRIIRELATQWTALGVDFKTNVVDTSVPNSNFVQTVLQPRNYDVLLYQLSLGADPDVYAYWHSSQAGLNGYNFANYSNTTSDAALASARSRLETNLRNAKYATFATQWLSDVPAIGVYQQSVSYVYNKNARTVEPSQVLISAGDRFKSVLYWSVEEREVYKTP